MKTDIQVSISGAIKGTPIRYTETSNGCTYRFLHGNREVSVQLIQTGKAVEYRNATNMPTKPSIQVLALLKEIAHHFAKSHKA